MRWGLVPFALGALLQIGGCALVPAYERGQLARPGMDLRGEVLSTRAMRKIHQTREGASGGDGMAAGGGCGCGN